MRHRRSSTRLVDYHRDLALALAALVVAVAAVIGGAGYASVHGPSIHARVLAWSACGVLLLAGVVAIRRLASGLGSLATAKSIPAAGGAVRLLASGAGYVVLVSGVFTVLDVSFARLLIGAGLISVVVGIAAQQSLGNVFAALVLLFARPFGVGDHIRVRSGSLGGVFDVEVTEIGLMYVTVRTQDGILKIPNSAMLASGIGQLDPPAPDDDA